MPSRLARVVKPTCIGILGLFFGKKYLTGEYFEERAIGVIWGFRALWQRNILRLAPPLPFPAVITCLISNPNKIHFHPNDLDNFQSGGTYFQCADGEIHIGYGTYIAPNVGIITANHDPHNLDRHQPAEDVVIGDHCWIGMNSTLMPGVVIGPRTIVGAGAVVTKSFPEGFCVLGGVPARVIGTIDRPATSV